MATIPKPPLNKVTGKTATYESLLQRARGGPEEPYITYEFGANRKQFLSTYQGAGVYGKPVTHNPDGTITHLPDPDLVSQNP